MGHETDEQQALQAFRVAPQIPTSLSPPFDITSMCRLRQVRTIFKKCNHAVTAPDEDLRCDRTNCKFSPNHPSDCAGDYCKKNCWQYRTAPQQYTEEKDLFCPYCVRAGYR